MKVWLAVRLQPVPMQYIIHATRYRKLSYNERVHQNQVKRSPVAFLHLQTSDDCIQHELVGLRAKIRSVIAFAEQIDEVLNERILSVVFEK